MFDRWCSHLGSSFWEQIVFFRRRPESMAAGFLRPMVEGLSTFRDAQPSLSVEGPSICTRSPHAVSEKDAIHGIDVGCVQGHSGFFAIVYTVHEVMDGEINGHIWSMSLEMTPSCKPLLTSCSNFNIFQLRPSMMCYCC